ncbi:hypothetical protein TPHA_0A03020 [Tetrapisispora phaffii CBS 4417]|uniref:FAD-binding FR-type domain-containing protein n=1 Tax=Tetrapisispora phaffii (strain ATCC 24235 / CBS 4417 / NBRC 1672 / NRRL Y-8282 / UCD 70-5) TaxID=1071381 RepID=G8BNA2_TETPH|nr:hypothetical protein TPHA_0A03020 [Tetrapisispora phaffii CBS 4417]CCE61380.1 hypothetical protein TPHA_0A03020 [Tetrapisispora phaffii CBS 4417]
MRLGFVRYLLPWLLIRQVFSLVLIDSTVASACIYYAAQFDWDCGSHSNNMKAYACRCANINWLGTVTNCIMTTTDEKHLMEKALKHLSTRCIQKADLDYTVSELLKIYENGTNYLRDSNPMDFDMPVYDTLNINMTAFEFYHSSFKHYTVAVRTSQWFGWGLVFYWVFIISVATVFNTFPNTKLVSLFNNNIIKKKLILPSSVKNYKDRTLLLWGFIPFNFHTRLNTLVVTVFCILTAITCCVYYDVPLPNAYLTSQYSKNINLISYRTDIMSISIFPLIYLFGTRNNPLIYISGIQFPTFIFYHKWCAYVCTLLAFIHSLIWTYDGVKNDTYIAQFVDNYFVWGVVAMAFMGFLVVQGEKVFRDYFYETFLVLHKIFNIIFIISMYYHMNILGWLGWVWSMAGILIYDRLMRIVRIIWNGGVHNATLSVCGDGIIKIEMKKPKHCKYLPGSFAYLYFLEPHNFWFYCFQSHAFSVLTDPQEDPKNTNHIIFYFKAQKGITKAMLNRILYEGRNLTCKMMIEGPYGTAPTQFLTEKFSQNTRKVGVAAGMGIVSIYPFFVQFLKNNKHKSSETKFFWIINDLSGLTWFRSELKFLVDNGCDLTIFVSRDNGSDVEMEVIDYDNKDKEIVYENENDFLLKSDSSDIEFNVIFLGKRPDLHALVKNEIDASKTSLKDIQFLSCGPPSFNDILRHSVVDNITSDLTFEVGYSEESFTW